MPHQCTACGHAFADGSKDMLGGCPDCGGNTFQFFPEGTEVPDDPPAGASADAPDRESGGSSVASTVGRATTRVRDFVSADPDPVDPPRSDRVDSGAGDDSAAAPGGPSGENGGLEVGTDQDGAGASADEVGTTADEVGANPDPDAPWPDSSDAADPIKKGGFGESSPPDGTDGPFGTDDREESDGIIDADVRATRDALDDAEDLAQSDARSGVASEAEVAAATDATSGDPIDGGDLAAAESTVDRDEESTVDRDEGTSASPHAGPSSPRDGSSRDDDLAPGDEPPEGRVVSEPTGEEPDLAELREQLNDQFESIKIIEPGQYELNLMELYDREEYIIALQENGRYVIQVPEQWMGDRDDR